MRNMLSLRIHRGLPLALTLAVMAGFGPTLAREGYFEQYCSTIGCHAGTSPTGSPADSPSCAACHYHGMREVDRRWKKTQAFRGWTDRTSYEAGQLIRIYVTGGDQPGWVRVRIRDHDGREVARATGPTGMGDDMRSNWTASVLPGPILLTARAPSIPGRYNWTVGWFGNIARPNPPAVLEGQGVIAHRAFVLDWHDVPLPPFEVSSADSTAPLVTGLTVTPAMTDGARQIGISALASDGQIQATAIGEARFLVAGGVLGPGGDWLSMEATDGAFDEPDERIMGALEVGDLPPGAYTAVVEAADIMGNWSLPGRFAFMVTPPPPGDHEPPSASCVPPKPSVVPPGQPVLLGAIIDDRASGGSPVHGAEAFVTAPGQDGSGVTLDPVDGVLASASELMQAAFATNGLADGEYPVLIHGVDATGLWGDYCEIAFEVRQAADISAPSVTQLEIFPSPTRGAAVATIRAVASDSGSGYGIVSAAELLFDPDTPPGDGVPMLATDGAFDRPEETATGTIEVAGLEPGAFPVGVRARDGAGWWSDPVWSSVEVTHDEADRSGPQILGVRLSPRFTDGSAETVLTGRIDDTRTGGGRPVLVEYFLRQPGPPGLGTPVVPRAGRSRRSSRRPGSDARFEARIDVGGLARDQFHTVYLRGMDEHGNWGPLTAAAFRVTGSH